MALADQLAQGVQFAQPTDPFAQYAKMQQLQQGQQANQLNQMKMQEYQRAAEETNALRRLDRSSPDYVNQLYRINPTQGLAYEKSVAESKNLALTGEKTKAEIANFGLTGKKTQSDIDKNKLDQQLKITEVASSVLRGVKDQATYDQAKRALSYLVPAESLADYPEAYDPGFVNAEMAMGQTLTQRLAAENAARVAATGEAGVAATLRGQDMTAGTAKAGQGVTMRGQDMTAASAAAAQGVSMRGQDMTSTTAKTAVSEQQAAYNIGRLLTSANQIKDITEKDTSSLKPGVKEAFASSLGMSGTANYARSANRQIVQGAQRDALDALLYLATGAAYNKEQLAGQMDAYIPAFTDTPEAVFAKQARMTDLIQSAKARAGKAWTPEMDKSMKALTSVGMPSAVSGKVAPSAGVDTSNPLLK